MAGKKGVKALDKLFPGRKAKRGELDRVSAEENPLGAAAAELPERVAYEEGEQDDFLESVHAHFQPAD